MVFEISGYLIDVNKLVSISPILPEWPMCFEIKCIDELPYKIIERTPIENMHLVDGSKLSDPINDWAYKCGRLKRTDIKEFAEFIKKHEELRNAFQELNINTSPHQHITTSK